MKRTILALILIAASATFSHAENSGYHDFNVDMGESEWGPVLHMGIGALAGGLTYKLIPDHWNVPTWGKVASGVGVGLATGFVIELFDDKIDGGDVLDYGAGAAIGTGCMFVWEWKF